MQRYRRALLQSWSVGRRHGSTTQTALLEQNNGVPTRRDQSMVETDLAEFVDHHPRARHVRITQQTIEQGRLAAAEEPGNDGDRDPGHISLPLEPTLSDQHSTAGTQPAAPKPTPASRAAI